jgi:hypothetical protein
MMKIREEVRWFAEEMEKQLRANEHKGGWQDCNPEFLLEELHKNYTELYLLFPKDTADICRRAANIANFAMMIADKYKAVKEDDSK